MVIPRVVVGVGDFRPDDFDYARAGSDVITANTFASSRVMLSAAGHGDDVDEILRRLERGETIDTGAFVAAVEYATGVRARVTGKPGPLMFTTAFRALAADVAAAGGARLRRRVPGRVRQLHRRLCGGSVRRDVPLQLQPLL